jgi:hypothetical protein
MPNFSELSQAAQKELLAKNSQSRVDQTSDFLSSNIQLERGLKLISRAEFDRWYQINRIPLGNEAKRAIYKTADQKTTDQVYADMKSKGIKFVDLRSADWTTAPKTWEIEGFKSDPKFGGRTMVTVRRAKDKYAWHRQHHLLGDLEDMFTSDTVEDLIDFELETTRSTWALKAGTHRSADIAEAANVIKDEVRDQVGPAARLVAEVDMMTPFEMASKLQDSAFREKLIAAKNIVNSVKAFK